MQTAIPFPVPRAAPRPWYTHRWPWLLMLGPALVIVAGSYAGWLAYSGQDAMVVDDYYRQGKAINQDLRRDRVASTLRLSLALRYDPARGVLAGSMQADKRAFTTPLRIYLAHATQPQKDIQVEVRPDAGGNFEVPLALLERGRWQVVVEGAQRDWRLAHSWQWPQQLTLAIVADAPATP
ncbi:MAG: FixH family protein [Pseudomonadota bacterium]